MSHHAKGTRQHTIGTPLRGTGVLSEHRHDPYQELSKFPEPSACPDCQAVFHEGRWQWATAVPQGAQAHRCPACWRVRDRFPAGYVTLTGPFFAEHEKDIMGLVRSHAEHARAEHPLQRIMDIEPVEGGVQITTTDIHLAHGLGEALHSAWRGVLATHYETGQSMLRVHWSR